MKVDWETIYRETWDDLVRYLFRRVWDAERARDLAQETFVRALGRAPDDPRAWLFTVAANLARDEARRAIRRRRHLRLVHAEAEAATPNPSAAEETERRARLEDARRALERLREKDREVLLLWDSGLSYREIAAHTGLAPGAIGTTLARARRRLVEAYREERGEDAAPE